MRRSTLSAIIAGPLTAFFMSVTGSAAGDIPLEDQAKLNDFGICLNDAVSTITFQMPSEQQLKDIGMTAEEAYEMLAQDAIVDAAEDCAKEMGIGFERTPNQETKFRLQIGHPVA